MPGPLSYPRTAVVSAGTAVVALVGGWTWAAALQPGGFDQVAETVSALAATTTPRRWLMTWALAVTGLAHLVTAWALGPLARRTGRMLLAGAGVATLAAAAFPLPSRTESAPAHTLAAAASFGLLALWPWFAGRADGPMLLTPRVARLAGGVLAASVLSLAVGLGEPWFGLQERVVAALTVLWPFATAAAAWWWSGHRIGSRRVRQVLVAVALTVGCAACGVAATATAPVTAQTRHYEAQVWLDPDPRHSGDLVASTTFGDVVLDFPGLAPGVRAVPQVRTSIADVLARPGVSLSTLRPGPEELSSAVRGAAVDVLGRFAGGGLLLVAAVLGGYLVVRQRPPSAGLVVGAIAAWLVSTGGTAAAAAWTYQPSRQPTFTTTQVLGTLQQNQTLLDGVENRAEQATPYVRNLLALSTALQQKYAAEPLTADPALRVLLVSDVHAGNQYALMRSIVQTEEIDVVIDSGDLVTFGTVEEGEAAGIFRGIAALGVPYLFVRGNHDATGPADRALLARLDLIPNVVLLHPSSTAYTEAIAGGVRLAGFNDPRWYGDSGTRTREAQEPARRAFAAAFEGRPPVDLLVSHEPWAVQGLTAGVLVGGHMHVPDLEGNRVQVGTFTGGGPFSYFIHSQPGEELVGQPSAFDVLTFGTDCRLASLARYSFRAIVEGRPAYDDVSLVNGRRIDTRPTEPGRTCTPDQPLRITTIPASGS
jgi:predicted phosphodiesterase